MDICTILFNTVRIFHTSIYKTTFLCTIHFLCYTTNLVFKNTKSQKRPNE